jgi:hypothetical protein
MNHSKLDEMVQIEAIAIEEGIWTDMNGNTLMYTPDILIKSVPSFVGRPIIYPHTDLSDDMKKVVGTITEAWAGKHDGKTAVYIRGLIHDEEVGMKLLEGLLQGCSVEADFTANKQTNPPTVISLDDDALALTDRPACATCIIQSYPKRVTSVKLEKGGREMSTDDKQALSPEQTAELEKKIKQIVAETYPMPKTKAWGDMSKEEKMGSCTLFFKNCGYPVPTKYPKKTKSELSGKEEWEFPEETPVEFRESILALEKQVTDLLADKAKLSTEVTKRDTDEVNRLATEIKTIDTDFNIETVTKMSKCPCEQKVYLQAYLDNVVRLKPKFSVGAIASPSDDKREDKIFMDAFGANKEQVEKELSKVEGGKK